MQKIGYKNVWKKSATGGGEGGGMPPGGRSLNLIYLLAPPLLPKIKYIKYLKRYKDLRRTTKKEPNPMAIYAISISLMRDVLLIVAKERLHFPTDLSF